MAGSSALFGPTEFSLRLLSAISGIAAVVFVYLVARKLGGRAAGVLAAALLFGVPQFIAWSRLAMTDVPLVALGLLAILLVLCGKEQPIFTIAAGAAFGLAFLAKSVAAFLFAPGLVALIVARQGLSAVASTRVLLAALTALAVALPWHVYEAMAFGRSFLDEYLGRHVLQRFSRSLEGHSGGPFYYVERYFDSAGLLAGVHAAGIGLAAALAIRRKDRTLAALVVFALGAFAMVSAPATKIGWYLLPVFPAAALATAVAITRLLRRHTADFAVCALTLL